MVRQRLLASVVCAKTWQLLCLFPAEDYEAFLTAG